MKTMRQPAAARQRHPSVHVGATRNPPDQDEEHRVVQENRALVVKMARSLARRSGPGVEAEDLVAAGLMGVLRAVRCFDATLSVPFVLFAARHARWAMLTELRNTRPMRRTASERRRQLRRAEESLVHRLHESPSMIELAAELAASPDVVARWQAEVAAAEAQTYRTAAGRHGSNARGGRADGTGALGGSDDVDPLAEVADGHPLPDDVVLDLELAADLHRAIDALPPRLAGVVRETYIEGRRLAEVAEELGVTESRVSQLRSEAVLQLRHRLERADRTP